MVIGMARTKKQSNEITADNITPTHIVNYFNDLYLKIHLLQEDKHLMLESIKSLTYDIGRLQERLKDLEENRD